MPLLAQLSLLPRDGPWPQGLRYEPDFIDAHEEANLVAQIRALPLSPFQFWSYEGRRRVASFGLRYDFTHQRLEAADAIPSWLAPFAARGAHFSGLATSSIAHALVTEYDIGAGIGWHRDKKHFDAVFGLSLGLGLQITPSARQ
jgi:alkylated DNA repair dioxygenase AlkB